MIPKTTCRKNVEPFKKQQLLNMPIIIYMDIHTNNQHYTELTPLFFKICYFSLMNKIWDQSVVIDGVEKRNSIIIS